MLLNNPLFFYFHKTQDDEIGDVGAAALGNALKKNRTLMTLELRGEEKKKRKRNKNKWHSQTICFLFSFHRERDWRKRGNII